MSRIQIAAGLVAAGLTILAPACAGAAQGHLGPYVAVGFAYDKMPDRNLDIAGRTVSSQWKAGWGGLATLGYKWASGVRAEAELSGRIAKVTTFNGAAPWAGKQWDTSAMFNVLYDFDVGVPFTPFVGVGLGGSDLVWGDNFRVPTQPTPTVYDGDGFRPAWQGIAGVSYDVTPKVTVALDGRLKGSFGHYSFHGSVVGRDITNFSYKTKSVFATVRYSFR